MRCTNCPLFSSWNNESDKGESCLLFGDAWDNRFQYEDKEGNIVGCYIDRHYIEQTEEKYEEHLEEQTKSYLEWMENNHDEL
mgnify:FL=1